MSLLSFKGIYINLYINEFKYVNKFLLVFAYIFIDFSFRIINNKSLLSIHGCLTLSIDNFICI